MATVNNTEAVNEITQVPDWKRPAALGYGVITATFVILGGWSAVAKIDSAVVATGLVAVESSRKTIQHLEGGIIREHLVREGQRVEEGQVLFRLDPTQALASFDLQQNQLDAALAQEARLIAERDGADTLAVPEELKKKSHVPNVAGIIGDQEKQFRERRASLEGNIDVLDSKGDQLRKEIEGLITERNATTRQLAFIEEELTDLKGLLDKGLMQKSRVLSLEREKSRLEGIIGRSIAEQAKAESAISEGQLQIRQLRQKFLEDVSNVLVDVRGKIGDLREKSFVAKDTLRRIDILSPRSGVVQNLRVFTIGGVVKGGELLAEVVPEHDTLIVQAHIAPSDIEHVMLNMRAEVRFSAFQAKMLPIMFGNVESVSRDRLVDESNKQPYFLAQVVVTDAPEFVRDRLTAGMPADIILPTGERTVLDFLVRPLKNRLRTTFVEQ